jgi:hypothetical protein
MDQEQSATIPISETAPVPQLPAGAPVKKKAKTWPIILGAVVLLLILVGFVVLMMSIGSDNVGKIRDIFIIFMALESLVIGVVLVVLIIQISVLINLIQNEIKPIMQATNETVSTLKGTTAFISDHLAEPVIKMNEYLAGLKRFMDLLFPTRK